MSLTSYRAAPPRDIQMSGDRDQGLEGLWACGSVGWFLIPDIRPLTSGLGRPGGDLLSRGLSRSTIGAEGFHGRVRDGIGCFAPRYGHQAVQKAVISDQN